MPIFKFLSNNFKSDKPVTIGDIGSVKAPKPLLT